MQIVDVFLQGGFQLESLCTKYVDPVGKQLEMMMRESFPKETEWVLSQSSEWLSSIQSPHAKTLPLMNPWHVAVIAMAYLAIVFTGMMIMSFLPSFKVKTFSLLHNCFLTSLSAYMFYGIVKESFDQGYKWFGNPVDSSENGVLMAKMIWLFYFSKIFEFVDTFIMVVKKNNRQISFLHLYHHSSIFVIWWLVSFWAPGGEAYFSAAFNSFIHVVMYGYYFCSALGIRQVQFIKKYITMMQLTQFLCMMGQSCYDIATGWNSSKDETSEATYPHELFVLLFFYMQTMIALFANFFVKNYKVKKTKKE